MRPSLLDDVSAAEAGHGTGGAGHVTSDTETCHGTGTLSHKMSRHFVLEYPVDDPDDDEDDDFDEDDEDDEDEGQDEDEPETWQVVNRRRSAKGWSLLDFRD
ncbi:MAG: hypothetical protein ACRD2I_27260 [Vicinamibacterales bacterium]